MDIHTLSTILSLPVIAAGAFAAFSALASYLPYSRVEATEATEAVVFADEADIFAIDEDHEAELAAWSNGLAELVASDELATIHAASVRALRASSAVIDRANAELATLHASSVRALRKSSVRIDRAARLVQFEQITRFAIAANAAYLEAA